MAYRALNIDNAQRLSQVSADGKRQLIRMIDAADRLSATVFVDTVTDGFCLGWNGRTVYSDMITGDLNVLATTASLLEFYAHRQMLDIIESSTPAEKVVTTKKAKKKAARKKKK